MPTDWGPPTFEIDGIKMLPTARISPYEDAERKVGLIGPSRKSLGYFAAWYMQGRASKVLSYEKNPDVIWLRSPNPWSPKMDSGLTLTQGDIAEEIVKLPSESVEILHDPPALWNRGRALFTELL